MRSLIGILLLACSVPMALASEPAATTPAQISVSAQPASVDVGDEVKVTITMTWPANWKVVREPNPGRLFRNEMLTALEPGPVIEGDTLSRQWRLVILARQSGNWELPVATAEFISASGETITISAEAPVLTVDLGSEAVALPAARGLYRGDENSATISQGWWWLAGPGAVAIIIALALWLRRQQETPSLSTLEHFQQDLQAVSQASDGKLAGSLLSLALRRYIGRVYSFDGAGATPPEIRQQLAEHMPAQSLTEFIKLLNRLDALRWGPQDLSPSTIKPLLDAGKDWVEQHEADLLAARQAAADQANEQSATQQKESA